ncbi:MAG: DNA-binding protein [Eubacteriales bacterium]|nr:DNA-binding protein [Eubacteriales bacterium]
MKYLSTIEIGEKWGLSSRRVAILCSEGRIEGAMRAGKMWIIPEDAVKPADARYRGVEKINVNEVSENG